MRARLTRDGAGRALDEFAPHLPAALVVVAWWVWLAQDGGYFGREWYPVALALVVLLAVIGVAARGLPRAPAGAAALGLLAAFVAWAYLSMLWTPSPDGAWQGANKLLLTLIAVAILALGPWTARSATALLGAWTLGVAAACAESLIGAANATGLAGYLVEERYADPLGYPNGTAAMAAMAFLPALALASRRGARAVTQVIFLVAAVFLLDFALLPQTRTVGGGLLVALAAMFALTKDRGRMLLRLLVVLVIVSLTWGSLVAFYEATNEGDDNVVQIVKSLHDAARAIGLATLAALVAGGVLAAIDRSGRGIPRITMPTRRVAVVVGVIVAAGAIAVGVAGRDRVSDRAHALRDRLGPRLTSDYDEGRSDQWRVAVRMVDDAPVIGEGGGSFYGRYNAERRRKKYSRYVHDIWLRAFAEYGIVGFLLLVGAIAAVLAAVWRRARRVNPPTQAVVAACVATTAYFLVHASVDWLEEFPLLATAALGFPFIALACCSRARAPVVVARTRPASIAAAAACAVLAVAAVAALTAPYVAVRYLDRANERAASDPAGALSDLRRARSWNGLAVDPWLSEGVIDMALGERALAQAAFKSSIGVEDNWYAHFELGLLATEAGRPAVARRELDRAIALNSADPVVQVARKRIVAGERLSAAEVNGWLREADLSRFRPTGQ